MKFKPKAAEKAVKQPLSRARTAIIVLIAMVGVFCLWGLWDIAQWNILYPGKPYNFPFELISEPWWIAGDILVAIAAACILLLAVWRSGKK